MTDKYIPGARPDSAQVRTAAEIALNELETLTALYQEEGIDLRRRHVDPMEGSNANLQIARNLAFATNPLRQVTGNALTLESLGSGYPSVKILPQTFGSHVGLVTPGQVYELTEARIHTVFTGGYDVPRRVRLLEMFGRQTPAELIGIARDEAGRDARTGITIFSRFTGRGR